MTEQLDRLKAALADRYAIERELGAGGMATVYLAEDLKHGRHVAAWEWTVTGTPAVSGWCAHRPGVLRARVSRSLITVGGE